MERGTRTLETGLNIESLGRDFDKATRHPCRWHAPAKLTRHDGCESALFQPRQPTYNEVCDRRSMINGGSGGLAWSGLLQEPTDRHTMADRVYRRDEYHVNVLAGRGRIS